MRPWGRISEREYRHFDLRVHEILSDVPLHDVWSVELPGGGPDRTINDVRALLTPEKLASINPVVRALFGLRAFLGRLLGWDAAGRRPHDRSCVRELDEEDVRRSLVAPGTPEGQFNILYVHPFEAVSEIRNATVHAFSSLALQERPGGYRLLFAIYVEPVGRITRFYMALIDPFRRFLIYPAILRHIHRSWCRSWR
jgi:hypothetical protein